MKMSNSALRKISIIVLVHVAFVGVWWGAIIFGDIPTYILPTPWEALQTLKIQLDVTFHRNQPGNIWRLHSGSRCRGSRRCIVLLVKNNR